MTKTRQQITYETLLTLLETLPAAMFIVNDDAIVYANERAQALLGISAEHMCGLSFWRCASHLVSPVLYRALQQIKQTREPANVIYMSPATNRWWHVSLSSVKEGIALVLQEQPEPVPHQPALNRNESLYRELLESFVDGVTIVTPDGLILDINQRALDDIHLPREKVVGTPFPDMPAWSVDPTGQQFLRTAIARASQGETMRFEARIHPRTDLSRDMLMTITSHRDANRQIDYLICTSRDITERKQTEDKLHTLVDAIPQLVWIANPDGLITYTNQRLLDFMAMAHEQTEGNGWLARVHPDDRSRVWKEWRTSIQECVPYEVEHRLQDGSSGIYRWVLVRGVLQRDAQGTLLHWVGTCTDIHEQKRTEEALRQSQERIRALITSNIIGIVSSEGEDEVLTEANEAFLRMTGYTQEEIQSRTLNRVKITSREDAPLFQHALQELAACGQHPPMETELLCKDGIRLPVLLGGVTFQDHPRQVISFVLDNSARKELEQRKEDFLSIASHELKTPLTSLKLQVQLARKRLEKQDLMVAATALLGVERPIEQLERLIAELLDVSKIQAGQLEYLHEQVDLGALLQEVGDTIQQITPTHTLVIHGATPYALVGDTNRLGQVFLNLLSNAIKYSPGAKTVEMDLSVSPEMATIRVRDYGIGIPREQCDHIFERFYRVSGPNPTPIPGLGMGLYIVAEIVKRHGGTISVESTVGEGSTFTVMLPRKRDD